MVYFFVGIAGALGAILRYFVGVILFTGADFPLATLIINLIGSFLLAWFVTNLFQKFPLSSAAKTAIGTGFVGSFTTFSAVSAETVESFHSGKIFLGILYVVLCIFGGMFMSRLGFKMNREGRRRNVSIFVVGRNRGIFRRGGEVCYN